MKQYLDALKAIQERGTYKSAARENMPGTQSLFGYQFRHNLAEGFPILTTKKVSFKNIVTELVWFLKGDTNIKYLDENGCRKMWHEDAYNYYKKIACNEVGDLSINNLYRNNGDKTYSLFTFEQFCEQIKLTSREKLPQYRNYTLGDCGEQYGKLWRKWKKDTWIEGSTDGSDKNDYYLQSDYVDQLKELINGLVKNPTGRRHIITAWNPATLDDMALNACHAMFQFNCRPISEEQRVLILQHNHLTEEFNYDNLKLKLEDFNIPKYYLDCQLYQRSADSILGVPYNIASYALLTHILAKICNMIPGEFIHSFGDLHIYDNHKEAVEIQLQRTPKQLPTLQIDPQNLIDWNSDINFILEKIGPYSDIFKLEGYNPDPAIKAELSTGLIK